MRIEIELKLIVMNRQRFAVFFVAAMGVVATFLPWYRIEGLGVVSGFSSSGWFTFIMFAAIMLLVLRKNPKEDMTMGISWCTTIVGLLAMFVVLWRVIDVYFAQEGMFSLGGNMSGIMGSQVHVAYGAWLVVAAGVCVPLAALIFRDRHFRRA